MGRFGKGDVYSFTSARVPVGRTFGFVSIGSILGTQLKNLQWR